MQPAQPAAAQPPLHAAVDQRPAGAARQPRPLLAFSAKGCTHSLKLRESFKLGPQLQLELGADLLFPLGGNGSTAGSSKAGATADGSQSSQLEDSAAPSPSLSATARITNAFEQSPPPAAVPARPRLATAEGLHFAGPWVALQWQLDPADRSKGVLRADAHHVSYSRQFQLGRKGDWWAVPLDAGLGITYSGQPHVALGISNAPLVLGLAAALLIAGKPVHLAHKEVGGLAVHFPLSFGGARHKECLQERVEVDMTLRREGRGLRCQLHELNGVVRLREE